MGLFDLFFGKKRKALEGIPGPKPRFPLGNALLFLKGSFEGKQAWEVLDGLGQEYGKLVQLWLGPSPALLLNDPEYIEQVLASEMDNFYKKSPVTALIPVTTDLSPFVLNGAEWAKRRTGSPLSQDWFAAWLASRFDLVRDYALKRADELAGHSGLDLWKWSSRLTFDIFSMALVGKELGDQAYKDFMCMGDTGSRRIKSLIPIPPFPLSPLFYSARSRWRKLFLNLVVETKKQPDPKATDLINTVLVQQPQIDEKHLSIIVYNVYFGGAYSAASGIGTNLYLMSRHPKEAQPTYDQLRGKLDSRWTYEDMKATSELEYSLMESLRLLTPVPLYTRNSLKDKNVPFAGHQLPKNLTVFISNWLFHRSESYWKDALKYLPQRWANGGLDRNPIGSSYFFPFGRGPRMCLGRPFALFIMRTTLAVFHARLQAVTEGEYKQGFYFGVMIPEKVTIGFEKAPKG